MKQINRKIQTIPHHSTRTYSIAIFWRTAKDSIPRGKWLRNSHFPPLFYILRHCHTIECHTRVYNLRRVVSLTNGTDFQSFRFKYTHENVFWLKWNDLHKMFCLFRQDNTRRHKIITLISLCSTLRGREKQRKNRKIKTLLMKC